MADIVTKLEKKPLEARTHIYSSVQDWLDVWTMQCPSLKHPYMLYLSA